MNNARTHFGFFCCCKLDLYWDFFSVHWYEWKLLSLCQLVDIYQVFLWTRLPLHYHALSMHIGMLDTKQDNILSSFHIHMSLLSFSSFVVVEKFFMVVQKRAVMVCICLIPELYWEPPSVVSILPLPATQPFLSPWGECKLYRAEVYISFVHWCLSSE